MLPVLPSRALRKGAAAVAALALTACDPRAAGGAPAVAPAPTDPPSLTRQVVMSGLSNPWDVAVAADGSIFFTEKCRGLSVRRPDGTVVRLFGTSGSATVASDLVCVGQSGAMGVALDPQFATNRRLYLFMTSSLSTAPRTNRILRLDLDASRSSVVARTDIVTDIPLKDAATANGGAGAHSGGRLRFGPDGYLYIGTGDNHDGPLPQHPTRLGGKVLRVTTDGAPAPGNGAPAGFDPRIYTYGHRNVQGIAFQPGTGAVYVAEHGPNHSDEVTRLSPGGNAGWDPQNRPTLSCPGGYCGYAGTPATMPMTDVARFPQAMPAAWNNNAASQGMGPAVFLDGEAWQAWRGRLAVGIMGGQRLVIATIGAEGRVSGTVNAPLPSVRYRALTLGPDRALYVATDAGEVWRVIPGPGGSSGS